ncbi:hypothetical protein C8A03DRAFT_20033 [Achaetomium macrosporum]|uniref:Uncharacterized protein n=1 Tax=Achaetomium macrosporum TaxID=79813 RepID=A0AAN7C0T7_9PEZI|nr:hypothetical protein C8A03DRAFT_20033 [Achaetomium macrosporum]
MIANASIRTPTKGNDVIGLMKQHTDHSPTKRLIGRKIAKALDAQITETVMLRRRIETLEAKVEELQPKKRKKVRLDPNTKFATIEDIVRMQEKAVEGQDEEESEGEGEEEEQASPQPLRRSTRTRKPTTFLDDE